MLTWEGSWPNSLVWRPPWLHTCSVKNKLLNTGFICWTYKIVVNLLKIKSKDIARYQSQSHSLILIRQQYYASQTIARKICKYVSLWTTIFSNEFIASLLKTGYICRKYNIDKALLMISEDTFSKENHRIKERLPSNKSKTYRLVTSQE